MPPFAGFLVEVVRTALRSIASDGKKNIYAAGDEIVERDVPNIPRSARGTITGKVKVRVRVNVDSSGNVVGAKFDARGPSEYFARQAEESARRWKFTASPEEQRQWVLLFEFARGGTQVIPTRVSKKH